MLTAFGVIDSAAAIARGVNDIPRSRAIASLCSIPRVARMARRRLAVRSSASMRSSLETSSRSPFFLTIYISVDRFYRFGREVAKLTLASDLITGAGGKSVEAQGKTIRSDSKDHACLLPSKNRFSKITLVEPGCPSNRGQRRLAGTHVVRSAVRSYDLD